MVALNGLITSKYMIINNISLLNVRNHSKCRFDLSDDVVFTGLNGSGKTTVLEAIYLLLAMRGFKKQPLSKTVSFGKDFMVIEGEVSSQLVSDLKLRFDGKKTFTLNGCPIEKVGDYIYNNPVACFSPDYQGVLSKDHSERRSFIDRFLSYTSPYYLDCIRKYNRVISQKSALFDLPDFDRTYVDILNSEIASISRFVSSRRVELIKAINGYLEQVYNDVDFKIEPVFLSYSTNIGNEGIFSNEFIKRRCDYGIHRDKIDMSLDGVKIEKFSSFGQKKTFAMLCLLGAIKHVENFRKISIITLLDDFEAGLDSNRAALLKDNFSCGRQALYTCVESPRLSFKKNIKLG